MREADTVADTLGDASRKAAEYGLDDDDMMFVRDVRRYMVLLENDGNVVAGHLRRRADALLEKIVGPELAKGLLMTRAFQKT